MNPPLACPHCQWVLPPSAPGQLHCGRCGKLYTIATPEQLAVIAKKRSEERNLLLIGGVFLFVVYVAPVLLTVVYLGAMMIIYLVIFLVFAIVAAAG
jgi:hypothetical protein